jgi:hypothetical protein
MTGRQMHSHQAHTQDYRMFRRGQKSRQPTWSAARVRRLVVFASTALGMVAITVVWGLLPSTGCKSCGGCINSYSPCGGAAADAGTCPIANGLCRLSSPRCRCADGYNCNDAGSNTCVGLDQTECTAEPLCAWVIVCESAVDCLGLNEGDCNNRYPNCAWSGQVGCD